MMRCGAPSSQFFANARALLRPQCMVAHCRMPIGLFVTRTYSTTRPPEEGGGEYDEYANARAGFPVQGSEYIGQNEDRFAQMVNDTLRKQQARARVRRSGMVRLVEPVGVRSGTSAKKKANEEAQRLGSVDDGMGETWEDIRERLHGYNKHNKTGHVLLMARAIAKAKVVPPLSVYSEIAMAMAQRGGKGGKLLPQMFALVDEVRAQGLPVTAHMVQQFFKAIGRCPNPVYRQRVLALAATSGYKLQSFDHARLVQSCVTSSEVESAMVAYEHMMALLDATPSMIGDAPTTMLVERRAQGALLQALYARDATELAWHVLQRGLGSAAGEEDAGTSLATKAPLRAEPMWWAQCLSASAQALVYERVAWLWRRCVTEGKWLVPDDATCVNVVLTCVRRAEVAPSQADAALAAAALRVLVARGVAVDAFLVRCAVELGRQRDAAGGVRD
ncbi:uncharacterized protein V1518DRAFT_184713 [Limtongia smithiae]|uniref:uncharacterized protein n=1 Tax=Limtongia smithiae TaxID=1125753 RepID=UPI0034CDCD5E